MKALRLDMTELFTEEEAPTTDAHAMLAPDEDTRPFSRHELSALGIPAPEADA